MFILGPLSLGGSASRSPPLGSWAARRAESSVLASAGRCSATASDANPDRRREDCAWFSARLLREYLRDGSRSIF